MTDTTTPEAPHDDTEPPAVEAPATEPVPFWQRPLVDRFLVPLVLPIVVVVGLVVYIINISRIFLSGHGEIPVIVGTAITLLILAGAAALSRSAHRVRQGSIALISVGFVLLIVSSGWLVLGSAEDKETEIEVLPTDLTVDQEVEVTAAPGGALSFVPPELEGVTGLDKVIVQGAAPGHTFAFTNPDTLLSQPLSIPDGGSVEGVAYFAEAGDYEFICTIEGHAAGGMRGTMVVAGEPVPTLEEALARAGNPPLEG